MTERLLQFIWQFQYFNKNELTTTEDEHLQVLVPGQLNRNQGPDFLQATVRIGTTKWVGNVELHLKASDWKRHRHEKDNNYNNVILHVVWENDGVESAIPVLEVKSRVSKILLNRYRELMNSKDFIPCAKSICTVRDIVWQGWKERLLAERLLRKAGYIESLLKENQYHWEETFWWMLAKNFGMKVNADAFEAIAKSISIKILAKHKNQVHQLEALLLGQAGLLDKSSLRYQEGDNYPVMLQKEYLFLKNKFSLKPIHQPVYFLRMRPGNFPTIRLAQLAMLIHDSAHLFSKITETASLKSVREFFDITANDYWHYHYRFEESSSFKKKKLGVSMIDNILINTVCQVLFAYGNYHNEDTFKSKALKWLEETTAESNAITKGFQQLGIENKNAFDSQALIELKKEYCNKKRCLDCAVGNALLKNPVLPAAG